MTTLKLTAPGLPDTPAWHLSVDGMSTQGPNLSHWPGNRTPRQWKADLSTGICLNFAKAREEAQLEFLAGATSVLNDHYDTDGFLSLLCVLRPDLALSREERILEAAATGDYQSLHSETGFAIDRIVLNLARENSPVAHEFAAMTGTAKDLARYQWLIEHAEEVLDEPERFAALYESELDVVQQQLQDRETTCERRQDLGLAFVRSRGPVHRTALNTLAADCYRVLHTELDADSKPKGGHRYRYHDRTESWFEVQTFDPPSRRDLAPLAAQLAAQTDTGQPTAQTPAWHADSPNEPVPELYFGIAAPQIYGQITRQLGVSELPPELVEGLFAAFFAADR